MNDLDEARVTRRPLANTAAPFSNALIPTHPTDPLLCVCSVPQLPPLLGRHERHYRGGERRVDLYQR